MHVHDIALNYAYHYIYQFNYHIMPYSFVILS